MKNSFGFGSEGIASYFINIAFPVISQPLCDIFNFSIYTGMFPDSWITARVAPILRMESVMIGLTMDLFSVLLVLSRLFEKLVYDQLYNHLYKNKCLFTFQSGFRTLHFVVACLLKSSNDWYVNIDNSKAHAVLFIDLKKAFDTVDHDILLAKLHHYDTNGIEHNWYCSYLNDRKRLCKVNGESSKIQFIEIGVPQGSCLGPLLFLRCINDLPFALREAHVTIYADDTTISYSSDNMEDLVVVVKSELSRLNRWLEGNKLSLTVVKTQAMIMKSKQKLSRMKQSYCAIPRFHLETEDIDIVNQTRYLGLISNENLKWDSQIKNMQTKILRTLGFLK